MSITEMMPTLRNNCASKRTRLTWFVSVAALCASTNGCVVLTSEWRCKPEVPAPAMESHSGSEGKTHSRIFDTPEFTLEITVENGPVRWEAPFLFYVLPIPTSYDYLASQSLRVEIALQPRLGQIAFDPWQTFFVGTNQVRVPPAHIWQNQHWIGTNASKALPVTTNTMFAFEFSPWGQVYPDRAMPFQLSIEGLRASGRPLSFPPVTFKPEPYVRLGFQLPY